MADEVTRRGPVQAGLGGGWGGFRVCAAPRGRVCRKSAGECLGGSAPRLVSARGGRGRDTVLLLLRLRLPPRALQRRSWGEE